MPDLRVEFHCHTIASKDSLTTPARLVETARRKGLDRVIVTDHNSIEGARAARLLDPGRVIVGEEIMTTHGEILAAFVTELVPMGLTPEETIRRLRDQGAFISVSHPFDRQRAGSWKLKDLIDILPLVDAIEVFNSRCMEEHYNQMAQELARQHNMPGTVGSDAHAPFELGRSVLVLQSFENTDGLRRVIRAGRPESHLSPLWVHLASRYATLRKRIESGLDMPKKA